MDDKDAIKVIGPRHRYIVVDGEGMDQDIEKELEQEKEKDMI